MAKKAAAGTSIPPATPAMGTPPVTPTPETGAAFDEWEPEKVPVPPVPEVGTTSPPEESLDDYFDRLDAAFASLSPNIEKWTEQDEEKLEEVERQLVALIRARREIERKKKEEIENLLGVREEINLLTEDMESPELESLRKTLALDLELVKDQPLLYFRAAIKKYGEGGRERDKMREMACRRAVDAIVPINEKYDAMLATLGDKPKEEERATLLTKKGISPVPPLVLPEETLPTPERPPEPAEPEPFSEIIRHRDERMAMRDRQYSADNPDFVTPKIETAPIPQRPKIEDEKEQARLARIEKVREEKEVLRQAIEKLRWQIESLPDEGTPKAKLAELREELEKTSKVWFRRRGKLEREISSLEIAVDREKNPFKWFLFDKIDPKNFKVIFGVDKKNIRLEDLDYLAVDPNQAHIIRPTLYVNREKDYAVLVSENGFYLRLKNIKEVPLNQDKLLIFEDPKAQYDLIGPNGEVWPDISYQSGTELIRDKAFEYTRQQWNLLREERRQQGKNEYNY